MKWLKKNKLKNTTAIELIKENSIESLRTKIKILIVDDEDIDIYKTLESRKYDVYYKKDMSYAIEAEPFDIVIMDIKGVGSSRQSKSGGLSLACEVKGRYPLKKVGCCSVSRINTITEKLSDKKIDFFFRKEMEKDKMCDKIDELIKEYVNIDEQWSVLSRELRKNGIDSDTIEILKEKYMKSFESGDFSQLLDSAFTTLRTVKSIIELISSVTKLMALRAVQ